MISEDSSVSSEEDSVPSNAVRFSVTAFYSRKDQGDEIQTQTFDVEAFQGESSAFATLSYGDASYPTIKADPFTVKRCDRGNSIIDFEKPPEGCVCLASFDSVKDINMVLRIAVAKKASAVLTVKEPTEFSPMAELPVFVVTTEIMNKLTHTHVEIVSVKFQRFFEELRPIDNCGTSTSSSDHNLQHQQKESSSSADIASADKGVPVPEPELGHELSWKSESESSLFSSTVVSSSKSEPNETTPDAPGDFAESRSVAGDELHPIDLSDSGMGDDFYNSIPTAAMMEQDVANSSCAQYTAEFREHGGSSKEGSSWSTFVTAAHSSAHFLRSDISYSIMVASVTRNENTGKVDNLTQDPRGRVLAYPLNNSEDINRVQERASKRGAVALFVTGQPRFRAELPVFVVEGTIIERLSKMTLATVRFSLLGSSIDRPPATPPRRSYAAVTSLPASSSARKISPSTEASSYNSDRKRSARSQPQDAAGKKSKGNILGEFFHKTKEFFVGKEEIFSVLKDRSMDSALACYNGMVNKIDAVLSQQSRSAVTTMISAAETFLQEKEWMVCHLVAAAHICQSVPDEAGGNLKEMILERISGFERFGQELGLLRIKKQARRNVEYTPRNVLFRFLTANADSFGFCCDGAAGAHGPIKLLLFLESCGLLQRKVDPEAWRKLRVLVNPDVFVGRGCTMIETACGTSVERTLALAVQRDLNAFLQMALEISESEAIESRDKAFLQNILVILLEEESPVTSGASTGLLSAWNLSLILFENQFFNKQACTNILTKFIEKASFLSSGTFSTLSEMLDSVPLEHRYLSRVHQEVAEALAKDLRSGSMDWPTMDVLFQTRNLANILTEPLAKVAAMQFIEKAVMLWSPIEEKLLLLDRFLKLSAQRGYGRTAFVKIRRQVERAVMIGNKAFGQSATLVAFLGLAASEKSLFHVMASTSYVLESVAPTVVTGSCTAEIIPDPSLLRELAITEDDDAFLYHAVLRLLQGEVCRQCSDIEGAASFYAKVFAESQGVSLALQDIADAVFAAAFQKWNPRDVTDFQPEHRGCVDALYTARPSESKPNDFILKSQRFVWGLVDRLLRRFNKDCVSRELLCYMLGAAQSQLWSSLESFYQIEFPRESTIAEKMSHLTELEESLHRSLTVEIDGHHFPLAEVLDQYGCEDHESLLSNCQYLFSGGTTTRTLHEISNDDRIAADIAASGHQGLFLCAYFIMHPSLLFRDRVLGQKTSEERSFEGLLASVREALTWFQGVFGERSTFAGVCAANKIISSSSTSWHSELSALSQCSDLKIGHDDIENFHKVKMLAEIRQPIQRFITCCEQFNFAVVGSESFAQLQQQVKKFYGRDSAACTASDCLAFFESLCHTLFPSCGENACDKLVALLPLLQLFSTLSVHPDLWTYASEQEWLGSDGLKRFYSEYGNVTNCLLGDAESYEMSLLDTMEATMRVVSAIGTVGTSSTSIQELFENCENHQDIENGLSIGIDHHITLVHSRLTEIKDWFSNGVDEIAAAHTLFSAVFSSGSYFSIAKSSSSDYSLSLTFTVETEEAKQVRTLQNDELDLFIQQLGLIQNESSASSRDMEAFVDQYQALARAAQNMLKMFALGYENEHFKISDFFCPTGPVGCEDAREILKKSQEHLKVFSSWLKSTRDSLKESLLFWTDELREMHSLIEATTDSVHPAVLAERAARLEPLWDPSMVSQQTLHTAVQGCAKACQARSACLSNSWLVQVSHFLHDLTVELAGDQTAKDKSRQSNVVLHSFFCEDRNETQAVLRILHYIYKDRLPHSFEILDGALPCHVEQMMLFLDRVKAFPQFVFAILNVDFFESKVLEKLMSFLADREIASLGICLHCIQRGETLHTAPWIVERSWDWEGLEGLGSAPPSRNWQSNVSADLSVVSSKSCGSGKTRHIRATMSKSTNRANTEVATIVVHENSSVASLIQSLNNKFQQGSCKSRVLHISVTFLPLQKEGQSKDWLRQMNFFFFCMVALQFVYDPVSATSFHFAGVWKVMVEMPSSPQGETAEWLLANIPILAFYSSFQEPNPQYVIDEKARRVSTYLRAFQTGTINRKFQAGALKRIVLVLDCSGSMNGAPFQDAVRNAVNIFETHVVEGDEFGVVLFDNRVYTPIPIQTVGADKQGLRALVQNLPYYGQGTSMYKALSRVLGTLAMQNERMESWLVCLTDGVSDGVEFHQFHQQLMATPTNLHMISVGINLSAHYEQALHDICQKYGVGDTKGFFVRSDGTTAGMDAAFDVVKSRIPVSQTFDLDGPMSDDECRQFISDYLPSFVQPEDKISVSFWVQFLYRRVKVFDNNSSFNYNETHDHLGSSLMEVMLSEVERLLGENLRRDWLDTNHAQLIYDFTVPEEPEFRLICTAPEKLEPSLQEKLSSLDLPGFSIPSKADLDQRSTLDRFLSQALDVPLQTQADGRQALTCIDEHGFILTVDFTMKLLSIHERFACRIPCLLEGETGVSKSALTKMYSILLNSSLTYKARAQTTAALNDVEQKLRDEGFHIGSVASCPGERLRQALLDSADEDLSEALVTLLQQEIASRPAIFAECPSRSLSALELLDFFNKSVLEQTFFDVNVDASLEEDDFVGMFHEIRQVAGRLADCDATVVVFLDEINTSSVLGLLKEVVIDHSIAGEQLEENIVVVGALNPARAEIQSHGRERDLGKDWASGHYQVAELPGSMSILRWCFGSLTHGQEKDFIFRRIEALKTDSMPNFIQVSLTEVVSESHQIMREFAERNILECMQRSYDIDSEMAASRFGLEARERAQSVVSLRDIQRVFSLYEFFMNDLEESSCTFALSESEKLRRAMLLSVAVVYYMRLDNQSRAEFLQMLQQLPTEIGQTPGLLEVLDVAMDSVIDGSEIPRGIAITRGLKENIFVTLVCTLSQTPLFIVGPPGCSKTLSVNVVDANANGMDSLSQFYRKRPRLSLFHYQCSKQSTSKEISAVFGQAIQRQERVDESKHRCVVFMDEAGLPESERESLKVLHYLLESHMSAKAKVGFVGISNHVLDAAKSNRCVLLLRQEPDEEEMQSITTGVLFDIQDDGSSSVHQVDIDGCLLPSREFACRLWKAYASLFRESSGLSHLVTFFGLRDYIFFLKALKRSSKTDAQSFITSAKTLISAVERNFNGISVNELRQVAACFIKPLASATSLSPSVLEAAFRHPMVVMRDALTSSSASEPEGTRYKLIIDCTEDDSILRLLKKGKIAMVTKKSLYKLSSLPDDVELERLRLISSVKFAALQGSFAVLSQTEPINESFYDLFNKHFQKVTGRDGAVSLYANIAVGGLSRRSLVRPNFECVVHVRGSNLGEIPAPFLNRFEKFRLSLSDVLSGGWSRLGAMAVIVGRAQTNIASLSLMLRGDAFGWIENQKTSDSLFVDILPHLDQRIWDDQTNQAEMFTTSSQKFDAILCEFIEQFTSLRNSKDHIDHAILMSKDVLPMELADSLDTLLSREWDPTTMSEALHPIVSGQAESGIIPKICTMLIEMVLTRAAAFSLIQVATPESIVLNHHLLPSDVVLEYFRQEHFSLKRLLRDLQSQAHSSSLNIIHTRTDQFVHSIPSLAVDRGVASDSESTEVLFNLISEQPHCLIIEHLSRMRSEALVRGAIQAWMQHETRDLFLLLVDMSVPGAFDQTNFVRMVIEQHVSEATKKTFVLLLHYPPSSYQQSQTYPALFLGGWNHVFLDSVGNNSTFHADEFVAFACQDTMSDSADLEAKRTCVRQSIQALLPRILPHLASQQLFYPDQAMMYKHSFHQRKKALSTLISTRVGQSTVADILSAKFSAMWLDHALFSTTQSASEALFRGTTQLSLSMSIHSALLQSFQLFLASTLADANQWMNLDLLSASSTSKDVLELFGLILQSLPVVPFEELVLQQKQSTFTRLQPLPSFRCTSAKPLFPFFSFLSEYFDEVVESTIETHMRDNPSGDSQQVHQLTACECYLAVMDKIGGNLDEVDSSSVSAERFHLAKTILAFVANNAAEEQNKCSLFERYLQQFLEWELGQKACPLLLNWFNSRIDQMNANDRVIALHTIARVEKWTVMKVASVALLAESLQEESYLSPSQTEADSSELFDTIFCVIDKVVAEGKSLSAAKWSHILLLLAGQENASMQGAPLHLDKRLALKLRRLSLYALSHKLGSLPATNHLQRDGGSSDMMEELSLSKFLEHATTQTEFFFLQFFLSPSWLQITDVFKESDLGFLLKCISEGKVEGSKYQRAVGLLRVAASGNDTQAFGFSLDALLLINKKMSAKNLSTFSSDSAHSTRQCLPHFIPEWLRTSRSPSGASVSTPYFSQYEHCFDCPESDMVFDLLLSKFAVEAEKFTSERLFLGIQREIHAEVSLNKQSQIQLSRLRKLDGQERSLTGSPLAAIAISARLVCFVAKIAFEVATTMEASVFRGVYSDDAHAFVGELMSLHQASWQSFFMGSILKARGEGTLCAVLGGPLKEMPWCRMWADGVAGMPNDAVQSLQNAETALAEAVAEEERKTREHRLCPHCQQQFIVAAANCGQFVCGRDAHQIQGQPALNNAVINGTHGCGQGFNLTAAAPYRADETILAPLRDQIAAEQTRLEQCQRAWEEARSLDIPPIVHTVKIETRPGSFLPVSELLPATMMDDEESSVRQLVRVLWESFKLRSCLQVLPDLVELYSWLHDTFRFLIKREDAFKLVMGDLMTKEQLRRRFDTARVQRLLALWQRCCGGLNSILEARDQKVMWQCETVSIPFVSLEKAKLVSLLSEGQHPTDGNDFLFLIINEMVAQYNVYIERLAATTNSTTGPLLSPKYIARDLAGAVIGTLLPLTKEELNWMVESSWNAETGSYDTEQIDVALRNAINLQEPSLIASPLNYLRERFVFRDDDSDPAFRKDQNELAIIKQDGLFFANIQDSQLVDEVRLLVTQGDNARQLVTQGDHGIDRALMDNFYCLDYDRIRAMLEGSRSLFQLMREHEVGEFQSVTSILDIVAPVRDAPTGIGQLEALGFPSHMSGNQSKLLLSLNSTQMTSLVKFAAYQLASEAYIFSALPLFLTDPLNRDMENEIKQGLDSLCSRKNVKTVVDDLDVFVRDVLKFYEAQIVEGASKTNGSLRKFLVENNFCDASDPIFAAMPVSVTLRHYANLRQLLHQIKLSFMYQLSSADIDTPAANVGREESLGSVTRGYCWLWKDEGCTTMDHDAKTGVDSAQSKLRWKLWFEQAIPEIETIDSDSHLQGVDVEMVDDMDVGNDGSDMVIVDEQQQDDEGFENQNDVLEEEEEEEEQQMDPNVSAALLQRWWRRETERLAELDRLAEMEISDEELSFQSAVYSVETEHVTERGSTSFDLVGGESDGARAASSFDHGAAADDGNGGNIDTETTYGTAEDEREMRRWLDEHRLPQTMADILRQLGARDVADIIYLVETCPDLLADIPPLDRVKLTKAARAAAAASMDQS